MRYRENLELQERLAAEYVLGTLRGRARLRFQAWMREDAALRRTVHDWEERLLPMAVATRPVTPPRRVWRGIEARIGAMRGRQSSLAPADGDASIWDSLGFWRNLGLVTSGLAAALVAFGVFFQPSTLERQIAERVRMASQQMQPAYVAMLKDAKGDIMLVAYAARTSDELWIKNLGMETLRSGTRYELWGIPATPGMPPQSLGLIPPVEKGTMKLASIADRSLADIPRLAVSMEPEGGSKTGVPTGPVMYSGECFKFW